MLNLLQRVKEQSENIFKKIFIGFIDSPRIRENSSKAKMRISISNNSNKSAEFQNDDKFEELEVEINDDEFKEIVEKIKVKRIKLLMRVGIFSISGRLIDQYNRFCCKEVGVGGSPMLYERFAKAYEENADQAEARGAIREEIYFRRETKRALKEADKYRAEVASYKDIISNYEQEIRLYKLKIVSLEKLLETIVDLQKGLAIERVIAILKYQIDDFVFKDKNPKEKKALKRKKPNLQAMCLEFNELFQTVKTLNDLTKIYSKYNMLAYRRKIISGIHKSTERELKIYESRIKRCGDKLIFAEIVIDELWEKYENGTITYPEYRRLRDFLDEEKRLGGNIVGDSYICEIIKFEINCKNSR